MRTTLCAVEPLPETEICPLSTVTYLRSTRLPSTMSNRTVPLGFRNSGSWPRCESSSKKRLVGSTDGVAIP